MVRVALLLVDDVESAKDCVRDAFVGLYRRPLRDPEAQLAYLHKSVVNAARSMLRRRRTAQWYLRNAESSVGAAADHAVLAGAERTELMMELCRHPSTWLR